ncbi:hypothetical protein TYRP_002778 [Tyrophagus putrescentiae]|nr:hypothetical protein TYRP_002778 [Tyrophagus putrescentiae]
MESEDFLAEDVEAVDVLENRGQEGEEKVIIARRAILVEEPAARRAWRKAAVVRKTIAKKKLFTSSEGLDDG